MLVDTNAPHPSKRTPFEVLARASFDQPYKFLGAQVLSLLGTRVLTFLSKGYGVSFLLRSPYGRCILIFLYEFNCAIGKHLSASTTNTSAFGFYAMHKNMLESFDQNILQCFKSINFRLQSCNVISHFFSPTLLGQSPGSVQAEIQTWRVVFGCTFSVLRWQWRHSAAALRPQSRSVCHLPSHLAVS